MEQKHKNNIQWYDAFRAAMGIQFEDEKAELEFREEYLLSKKAMQIDLLIVKKDSSLPLEKNVGKIFRKYNIIEYKSPEDYLSVNDYFKVLGYTCFYQSDTQRVLEYSPDEITMTFACYHFPRKMASYLQQQYQMKVTKKAEGIYYLENGLFPVQILVVPELSQRENFWLSNLRNDICKEDVGRLAKKYESKKKRKNYQAVMDTIMRANWKVMEEEKKMCEALRELFADELKEREERGIVNGIELTKRVFKLSAAGVTEKEIAETCGISVEEVRRILE